MDELLSAWTTSESLLTAKPLCSATALSAPAPQQPTAVESSAGADRLWVLQRAGTHLPVNAACDKPARKPDAGNPPVRFDEGEGSFIGPSLLYLANLYMRRFVLGWKQLGYEEGLKARIV